MRTRSQELLLAVALACCMPAGVAAQGGAPASRYWLGAGLAAGASRNIDGGVGLLGQLVYQREPHHAALRVLSLGDISGFPDSGGGDGLGEVGLLYGRTATGSGGHVAVAGGLSFIGFSPCPDDDDTCFGFGVPVVAEAAWSLELFGVGVQAFANLNPKATYGGVSLFLQLGWLP